jgi:hypothetical protein
MTRLLFRLFSLFLVGAFLLAACGLGNATLPAALQQQITETMQAVGTDAQATMQAAAPTSAPPTNPPAATETSMPTATLAPTEAPPPTEIPAPTETPAPVVTPISGPTSGPSGEIAHVDQNTYCRTGPSMDYSSMFIALAGTDLNIVSQTTISSYVIVQNPKNSAQTCWLWTHYVNVNGDISSLPVVTPPPVPTQEVNFVLAFYRVEVCTNWAPAFKIVNTGSKTLQSYKIAVKDKTTKTTETRSNNFFDKRNGCSVSKDIQYVDPGLTGFIYSAYFTFDPSGDDMTATITVCTHDDLAGNCETQTINFTP